MGGDEVALQEPGDLLDVLLGGGGLADLVVDDLVVEGLEELRGQVAALVDAAVVGDELGELHLVLDVGVVRVGVEHDEREGDDVGGVAVREGGGVALDEAVREVVHHAVDGLRLAGQPEGREQPAQRVGQRHVRKVEQADVRGQHGAAGGGRQVLADLHLRQPGRLQQVRRDAQVARGEVVVHVALIRGGRGRVRKRGVLRERRSVHGGSSQRVRGRGGGGIDGRGGGDGIRSRGSSGVWGEWCF